MQKMIRDGKVAVLVSHGFGAGWSTWSEEHAETLCMDVSIVQQVLDGKPEFAAKLAETLCPGAYTGGAKGLQVHWLDVGERFRITEYDGAESLERLGQIDFMVA